MRYFLLAVALFLPGLAAAQAPHVEITDVRIGFNGSINRSGIRGTKPTRFKVAAWAPVSVDLEVRDAALKAKEYALVIETTDGDDMQNVYVEKHFLPTIDANHSEMLLGYVRIGSTFSEITVKVVDANHPDGKPLARKQITQADIYPMPAYVYGYLTLGGKVSSLYQALVSDEQRQALKADNREGELPDPEENGFRSFAHVDQVQQMPTWWCGYQATDTVVLLSSNKDFANDLIGGGPDDSFAAQHEALAEWVRRGGRLIVSVNENHQQINELFKQTKLIDLSIDGRDSVTGLPGVRSWAEAPGEFRGLVPKDRPDASPSMEVPRFKPGRGVQVLAGIESSDGRSPGDRPIIVQAACGMGQVIVIGFDLDEQPFKSWPGRFRFWNKLRELTEPPNISNAVMQQRTNRWGYSDSVGSELSGKLVRSLESFPDVPVISFGWVALFILLYILIVGPLDYFFLKKVVKRLELTWITFPAVVIVISAVAYFAAYYLKGKELRINKVDVIDVDLRDGHVYGNTWFTLFSPRIQNYTIGVEPGNGWVPDEKDPKKYSPVVGWMGRPEDMYYGRGGQALFRRAYDYTPDFKGYADLLPSSGLVGVPIQVWSTKSFSASWHRPADRAKLIDADIELPKNETNKLRGTITSHLPVELRDVWLLSRDVAHPLDNLVPGQTQRIGEFRIGRGPRDKATWFNESIQQTKIGDSIKSMLFFGSGQGSRNSSFRSLDANWRFNKDNTGEVILFGRVKSDPVHDGNAEEVSQSALSPSRLWLGKLPGTGERSKLDGTLSQETYVRIYIPVK